MIPVILHKYLFLSFFSMFQFNRRLFASFHSVKQHNPPCLQSQSNHHLNMLIKSSLIPFRQKSALPVRMCCSPLMQYQESVSSPNWVCFPLQLSMNERHSFSLSFCLGEVSKYTNQIFGRIVERASNISSRITKLRQRVLDLEEKYPEIENKISATQDVSTLFNQDIGMQTVPPSIDDLEPSVTTKDENLSLQSLPRSEYIQSLYNKTRPDPDFNTLESAAGQDVCHFLLIHP